MAFNRTRGSRVFPARRAARPVTWDLSIGKSLFSSSDGLEQAFVFTSVERVVDETLLRSHVAINWRPRAPVAAQGGIVSILSFGFGVVSAEAALALAVPTPLGSGDWDGWLLFKQYVLCWPDVAGAVDFVQQSDVGLSIDSKAMRRIKSGDVLIGVASVLHQTVPSEALTVDFGFASRGLFKVI